MKPWATVLCLLLSAAPAAGQGLPELERIHNQRRDAHHDLANQIDRIEEELRRLGRELAPLIQEGSRLRGRERGLLGEDRAAQSELKRAQNAITAPIARRRIALRGLRDRERVARIELILACSDWVRRLLELASRPTARVLDDERGGVSVDRQARELLERARRGMVQLGELEALEDPPAADPWPIAETPTGELRTLVLDLTELGDAAREDVATLGRVAKARRHLVLQLELSLRIFPDLAQALSHERISLDRVVRLEAELKIRAQGYDKTLGSVQAEIFNRWLRQLQRNLRRIAHRAARWGEGRGRG